MERMCSLLKYLFGLCEKEFLCSKILNEKNKKNMTKAIVNAK